MKIKELEEYIKRVRGEELPLHAKRALLALLEDRLLAETGGGQTTADDELIEDIER